MSKRFYFDEFSEDIFDDEIQQYPSNQTLCNILNHQQERIAELEEQLKNATKQVRREVCEKFVEQFMLEYTMGNEPVEDIIYKVADQIQGDRR